MKRSNAARFERLQGQVDFSCKHFNNNMAISALQICTCTALSVVPTKVLIFRCCLSALNRSSIYHRSL